MSFQGALQPVKISAKLFGLFDKIHLKAVIGNGKGRRHAGNTAADNQRFLNNRNAANRLRFNSL